METAELDKVIRAIIKSRMTGGEPFTTVCDSQTVYKLLISVQEVLSDEPIVLHLDSDIVVVGDIHGNIDDLLRVFETKGYPPKTRYLFLGDYIDRGCYSIEVISLLFALKVRFPNNIFLIRGNHEIDRISSVYGFYNELTKKYGFDRKTLYPETSSAFYELPVCAVISDKVFCVHGGIGPNVHKVSEIEAKTKPEDVIGDNVFVDMLWSDPRDMDENDDEDFVPSKRGSGYYFSENAVYDFLKLNRLNYMIRSHELCQDGIMNMFGGKCLTVFSNTNYCYRKNDAAIAYIDKDCKPNIIYLPYVSEKSDKKVTHILPEWLVKEEIKKPVFTYSDEISSSSEDEGCLEHSSIFNSGSIPDLACTGTNMRSMLYAAAN